MDWVKYDWVKLDRVVLSWIGLDQGGCRLRARHWTCSRSTFAMLGILYPFACFKFLFLVLFWREAFAGFGLGSGHAGGGEGGCALLSIKAASIKALLPVFFSGMLPVFCWDAASFLLGCCQFLTKHFQPGNIENQHIHTN